MFQLLNLTKKILLGLVLLLIPIKVSAKISPTTEFYVNDYANILSEETEERIIELNKKLYDKTGAQIVIVTVDDLGGDSVENVANETFIEFKIGSQDKNNGLLILFSKNDRKVRVEVGYGLEGTLNDGKVGRMMDQYMIPLFKEDKFAEGLENGFNAFFNYLLEYYGIEDIESQTVNEPEEIDDKLLTFLVYFIMFIIIIVYITNHGDYYGGGYYGGGFSGGFSGGGGSFGGGGSSGGGGASRGF